MTAEPGVEKATAPKEDLFHTRDVIAELSQLPSFLTSNERWLAEAVAQLALKGCGREEIGHLLALPAGALNEELPSSLPEVGSPILNLDFLPNGARCIIQGSVSSAHLNGKRCTLQRVLLGEETHALVEVEGDEAAGAVLLARKNLVFDFMPQGPIQAVTEEELPPASQVFGSMPLPLKGREAEQWLCGAVVRLMVKGCGKEEIGFILSLPAKGREASFGTSSMPSSIAAEQIGMLLQDLSFCPSGAECRVEGAKSTGNSLNGLQGVLKESCPSYTSHAKLQLPGEGEVLIHRKNLRLMCYGTWSPSKKVDVPTAAVPEGSTGGLCSWFGCCSLSVAPKTSNVVSCSKTADLTGEIRQLADMKAQGLLSEEEFHAAKAKLLA